MQTNYLYRRWCYIINQKYYDKFNNSPYAKDYDLLDIQRTDRTYYIVRCKKCGEISPRRFERISMCSLNSPCTVNKKVQKFKETVSKSGLHQSEYWKSLRRKIAKDYYINESPEVLDERNKRRKQTLKDNHNKRSTYNFKPTQDELIVLSLLKSKFSDVKQNWKTQDYPYYCDFYIGDINTYIELHFGVFHYFEPFRGTSKQLKSLEVLKEKNTEFWDRVIYIWTESDVEKRNVAIKNKLNYFTFYNMEEFNNWFALQ